MIKSPAGSECYTIWKFTGITMSRYFRCRPGRLVLLLGMVGSGGAASGPKKAKGLKYNSLNTCAPNVGIVRVPVMYSGLMILGVLG